MEQLITIPELHALRAELDSLPGRSTDEVDDELWNLTVGGMATDTLASFRCELGLSACHLFEVERAIEELSCGFPTSHTETVERWAQAFVGGA